MLRILIVASLITLQGCAAALVAGGMGVASSVHDRRTMGTQIDDKTLLARVNNLLAESPEIEEYAHINVNVYNGIVLLAGQAPNDDLRNKAEQAAKSVQHIRKLHNLIRIGTPTTAGTRTNDVWLASKVKANLLADERVDGLHVDVMVEDSEVFLMGLVNANEANVAVDIARNISGVARVVKAFEYMQQ
ncbi:BON domain-containing protein [Neptunicella marina]|uniref:Divisome-associated lipoprotein YraP n=1 Tax=Neptunicella marina TaxID=2125989 RepID=A0A8J6ITR7_9ALTE|nr:BON domain-containing protein [Neptunicella marina]MBC3765268.1 divisome-associated lipoprotein YraP [Neptunicella marina]